MSASLVGIWGGIFYLKGNEVRVIFQDGTVPKPEKLDTSVLADEIIDSNPVQICGGVLVSSNPDEVTLSYKGLEAKFPRNAFLALLKA